MAPPEAINALFKRKYPKESLADLRVTMVLGTGFVGITKQIDDKRRDENKMKAKAATAIATEANATLRTVATQTGGQMTQEELHPRTRSK